MTNYNYYLKGLYTDGFHYFEKQDSYEDAEKAVLEIQDAEKEFIKMDSPKEHASSVVQYIGLQIISEVA